MRDSPATDDDDARLFDRRADRCLRRLLPGFGAGFGISVLATGLWDFLAGAGQTPASMLVRLGLVAAGTFAYRMPRAGPSPVARAAFIYLTHAAALASGATLAQGLVDGVPVLLAWQLGAGFLETRPTACLRMLAPAGLLVTALALHALPPAAAGFVVLGGVATMLLAVAGGAAGRHLRREAWRRERQLLRACRYDDLSGALSRGFLVEMARHDFALARRHHRPLAIALLDIDHFKLVNDTHGHAAGDAVIRMLVATCKATLRASDYVGRLGGEEFVCVMPEAGRDEALACAERIRLAFAGASLPSIPGLHCTVSIGVGVLAQQHDWEALLRDADGALYRAKNGGRDRVVANEILAMTRQE